MYRITAQDIAPHLARMKSYAYMLDSKNGEDLCQDALEMLLRYPPRERPYGIGVYLKSIKFALSKNIRKRSAEKRGCNFTHVNIDDIVSTNIEPYENPQAEKIIEIKEYLAAKSKKPIKAKDTIVFVEKPTRMEKIVSKYERRCLNCDAPIPSSIPFCSEKCRRTYVNPT